MNNRTINVSWYCIILEFFPYFFDLFFHQGKIFYPFSVFDNKKEFLTEGNKSFGYISDIHLHKGSIVLRNGSIWERI